MAEEKKEKVAVPVLFDELKLVSVAISDLKTSFSVRESRVFFFFQAVDV